jgi:asparagine synthase (glutamine-hydrolysing)
VTRWLAGAFDPQGRLDPSRLRGALAPRTASTVEQGPLRVAYSGSAADTLKPLCLLDGYIDNAVELTVELDGSACSSPEALLALGYRRWGAELLPRLRGDFALLIWDSERGEGLLARDQLGVRSIFLHDASGGLYFASEIRHLLPLLPRRPIPDPEGVAHWIAVSGRPGPGTLYAGIRRLEPGGVILLSRSTTSEQRYWTPRFAEPLDMSAPELGARFQESIGSAVQRRLSSNGITGVMMSGGLDSASIAAVAATCAPGQVAAYSAVFPEHPAVDESALIAELRGVLDLPGINAEVGAGGLVASAVESVETWQVPLSSWGDFWAAPLLRAAASTGVKVMLGGDGGDELFGVRVWLLADLLRTGHPRQAVALAHELPGFGDRPPRRAVAGVLRRFGLAGMLPYIPPGPLRRRFTRRDAPDWMRPATTRDLIESDDPLAWKRLDGPRWWANVAHVLTRGVEEAGVFEDHRHRATVAGIEARHPLFDLDLLELGLRQPTSATFDRYLDRPVMRTSMEGLLPDAVRLRPRKALFDSLLVDSLAGPDHAAVRELLSDPRAELRAYVDIEAVRRTMLTDNASLAAPFQWMRQLWRLITIECWLRAQADPSSSIVSGGLQASTARVTLQPVSNAKT